MKKINHGFSHGSTVKYGFSEPPDIPQARKVALGSIPVALSIDGKRTEAEPRLHEFELPYDGKEGR